MIGIARLGLVALGVGGVCLGRLPLSITELWLLAGVLYVSVGLPSIGWRRGRWLALGFVLAAALKVSANAIAPPIGLEASYFAAATPSGAPERSTDFLSLTNATRIDTALDFRGEDFPVHFFNDAARFNFGPDAVPGRDQLPFSVRWTGFVLAPSDGERRFVVDSNGPATLWLDGSALAADQSVNLSEGLHALKVEYGRPEARVPALRVRWQRVPGGPLETLGGADVRWQPSAASPQVSAAMVTVGASPQVNAAMGTVAASPQVSDALATVANVVLGGTLLAWLALGLMRASPGRALVSAVPLAFLAYGMLLEAPAAGRATIFSGLDDWLVYESSARDIMLNGPLMTGGQSHAAPFYGQPLYPYVLALAHALTGESVFGPLVLQFVALGCVAIGTAALARRAFGTALDGLVALASFLVLLQLGPEHFKIARQLFNENVYMPLVMASLVVTVAFARSRIPTVWWKALLSGGLLGLTAISRSQFLLCIPFVLLVLVVAWRGQLARALVMALLMLAGVLLVIAPMTARNLVVSGQFVPISSSGGASLLEFHRPPSGLIDQAVLQSDPLYNALHLDQQTRTVVAFVRADPGGYLATLAPLGAHSIGLQGRNDPGIYWPLFATFLLYLASFGLKRTRRLHVWPVHAFVGTHLLVLMLFEADTYGYRLVMPMYAPMVAVAAQLPLLAARALIRSRDSVRAGRFAVAGWSAIGVLALAWQSKGLVDLWPERETSLHGLGGAAAHAAMTADRVGAATIYVASSDGTPRRFGAGALPGLRYPWFKWFDPSRSLPLPETSSSVVYMLSELNGRAASEDLTRCLGSPDSSGEVVVQADRALHECTASVPKANVSFNGVARVDGVQLPDKAVAGERLEAQLVWQPLVAHPEPYQVSLQLDDPAAGDGIQWGNGTLELYPAREWQPDEVLLSRVPVATDATALPQPYRVTLGMSPTRSNAQPAMASLQGAATDRVPVGAVALTPGKSVEGQALPPDMQPIAGPPLIGGGLELIGARALPAEVAIGSSLQVGLLWRAVQDQPSASTFTMRLVGGSGEVVQESVLTLLGGRVAPSALSAGNVVRDEQKLLIDPQVPSEPVSLEVATADASVRLGSIKLTGRSHTFSAGPADAEATFGEAMQLLSHQVEPAQARAGAKVTVKLRWRAAAQLPLAYKVFVHVLEPTGQQVVAQRDAEPRDGGAPTTGWVVGEVIDDEYVVTLPSSLAAGTYPIEIGVYDPKSGERLKLSNGENRFLIEKGLTITP